MYIRTHSGIAFDVLNPKWEDVRIDDIAHSLSNQARYGGNGEHFYSVAEHCYHVSHLVPLEYAKWGLLHDATEAYMGDLMRPLKNSSMGQEFRIIESRLTRVIAKTFKLEGEEVPEVVKEFDTDICTLEKNDLFPFTYAYGSFPMIIMQWEPKTAKEEFLKRFYELY